MTQAFAAINHRLSEEYAKIDLPTLTAKERCARIFAPIYSLCSRTPPLHFTHRRALPAREIYCSQNCRRTDCPPRDTGRRQARHHRARLPAADDPHTALATSVTFQQRSARCGPCAHPCSNEASLALLERVLQGHALAKRPVSRTRGGAGRFKQVVAPLSPTPQTAAPIDGTSSSSSSLRLLVSTSATEGPREPVAETPTGDVSVGPEHSADVSAPAQVEPHCKGMRRPRARLRPRRTTKRWWVAGCLCRCLLPRARVRRGITAATTFTT